MVKFNLQELADILGIQRGKTISKQILLSRIKSLSDRDKEMRVSSYSPNRVVRYPCPSCGYPVVRSNYFCPTCGQRLAWIPWREE